mgnify:CR=1 FL=1
MTTPLPSAKARDLAVDALNEAYFELDTIAALDAAYDKHAIAIDAAIDAAVREEREACAKIAANVYPRGSAHTYASENADVYQAQESASERIAKVIRARSAAPQQEKP